MSLSTILLAVGDDETDQIERLAETAIDIAGPAEATVVVGHVFSKDAYEDARKRLEFNPDSEVTPTVIAERNTRVRELTELLSAAGVTTSVSARLSNGDSKGDRFTDLAEELSADLVIVGGRERTPAGKAVFGSTAQAIMLSAPCPVTFVRNE